MQLLHRHLVPLLLLHADGARPVEGRTRMQKFVFLAQEEGQIPAAYRFVPFDHGPYSRELQNDLDELIAAGLVEEKAEGVGEGRTRYSYSLTSWGGEVARRILSSRRSEWEHPFRVLEDIKRMYKGQSLLSILQDVYARHPEYAVNSRHQF